MAEMRLCGDQETLPDRRRHTTGRHDIASTDEHDLGRSGADSKRKIPDETDGGRSVSYTHLDVYKRQAICVCRNTAATAKKSSPPLYSRSFFASYTNAGLGRQDKCTLLALSLIHI